MTRPLSLALVPLFAASQTPSCSEVTCEETRTCGGPVAEPSPGGEGGASDGGRASSSGGGGSGGRISAVIGEPCPTDNARACPGAASASVLLCDDGAWTLLRECAEGELCDSRDPECEPLIPECAALRPGDGFCADSTLRKCGPDKVTTLDRQCPELCENGRCVTGDGAGGSSTDVSGAGGNVADDVGGAGGNSTSPADACSSNPCEHGTCAVNGDTYQCDCEDGYTGETCETNIDDCSPNPCENGGRCDDGVGGYECVCEKTFTGENCETPRLELLGTLTGTDQCLARAATPDGTTIIGECWDSSDLESRGFRWRNGVMESIGRLDGETNSYPIDLTPDGAMVVGRGDYRAFLFSGRTLTQLACADGDTSCEARGVSSDGRIIVGSTHYDPEVRSRIVRWVDEVPELIEVPDAQVVTTNHDGSIIIGHRWASRWVPFIWKQGTVTDLAPYSGSSACEARAASSDGAIIAGFCTINQRSEPVRWVNNIAESMGIPTEQLLDAPNFTLNGMNSAGTAAVGYGWSPSGGELSPTIWNSSDGTHWLTLVFEANGIDTSRWRDLSAADLSDDGKTIVGYVVDEQDRSHAYVAHLP